MDRNYLKVEQPKNTGNYYYKKKANTLSNLNHLIPKQRINNLHKNKKNKVKKEIKESNINEEEFIEIKGKRTFIENYASHKICKNNNFISLNKNANSIKFKLYFCSFVESYTNSLNKFINKKPKLLIRNQRNFKNENLAPSISKKINLKNSTTFESFNQKQKIKEKLINNSVKSNKNKISKKTNTKNNINSKYDISTILSKKQKILKPQKNVIKNKQFKEKNQIKNKEGNKEDLNCILDIESEHKRSINLMNKNNNFDINKPHDYNMKYSLFKEYEEEEENKIMSNKTEKVIIGNIDGYQDIIESDKINMNNKINKTKATQKYEELYLLEKNLSGFYDLNLNDINYKKNKNLLNIENEYDFEDLPTNENEIKDKDNKIKRNPFHLNKKSYVELKEKINS